MCKIAKSYIDAGKTLSSLNHLAVPGRLMGKFLDQLLSPKSNPGIVVDE
jgi:hypothetical protein